jgi:hypothetical protein
MIDSTLGLEYRDAEWLHGLACATCEHVFREGDRFTTLLYAFSEDVPVAQVVCLLCATGGTESAPAEHGA